MPSGGGHIIRAVTGNTGNNMLEGNSGADTIFGGTGNDTMGGNSGADSMSGGLGNYQYYVDTTSDQTIEALDQGTDTVHTLIALTLGGNVENLVNDTAGNINGTGNGLDNVITGAAGANKLYGLVGFDTLYGGDSADLLDGGVDNDSMVGGLGNDTYYIDSIGDSIVENFDEGVDIVFSSVTTTLADNLEKLTLSGTAHIDGIGNSASNTITGNSADNWLEGDASADTQDGGAGDDWMHGGTGNDSMKGGTGNDVYYVDAANDRISESADSGTDLVVASATFAQGSNVENLQMNGNASINARATRPPI